MFDSAGGLLRSWGPSGTGDGQFNRPVGVVVCGSGEIHVTEESGHRVQRFDTNGGFVTKRGTRGTGNGEFVDPRGDRRRDRRCTGLLRSRSRVVHAGIGLRNQPGGALTAD